MWLTSAARRARNSPSGSREGSVPRPASPSAILAETLRRNPFRPPGQAPPTAEDAAALSLNKDLRTLAGVFADIQIEVLRELLRRFDGESRLYICTEQLYKYKVEWTRGRLQQPPRDHDAEIPIDEQFRSQAYISATAKVLALEFRASSSKGSINAVLAEVNNSYTKARPILFDIANKTKWAMFTTAIGWKRKRTVDDAPTVVFDRGRVDVEDARLIPTGSHELDQELDSLYLRPTQRQHVRDQLAEDLELAQAINEEEATKAEALYECQVCYHDVTFENMAACTSSEHIVCLNCIRRTLNEAIFGQGWHQSVCPEQGTLKCLSSTSDCTGHIPPSLVQRAVVQQPSGPTAWTTFESRLFEASLQKSHLPLVRCPFCSYAEVENGLTAATARTLRWSVRRPPLPTVALILLLELLPTVLFCLLPLLLFFPSYIKDLFYTAIAHIAIRNRRTRFACQGPSCSRASCLVCLKPWHDPHVCHEPLIISLRTTVEAARTSAVKRVCPRCGTSFVKSSGCNKLTCVCGYAMCYLCRANIGRSGAAGNAEGAAGYRHFCEHFRPNPGQQCTECDKCDLYKEEDEDGMVRKAGEQAEREWREREGMVGVHGLESATGGLSGGEDWWQAFKRGNWTVQGYIDRAVGMCVMVEEA